MSDTRRQLVAALAAIDSQEEEGVFRGKLARYEQMDVKMWLESRLLETEEGFWTQVPLRLGMPEFVAIDSRYPKRIPALVSKPVTGFRNVRYFLCDNEMQALPSRANIMLAHHDPCRACIMIVDGKIKYQYVFASERTRPSTGVEVLYPILYSLACQIEKSQSIGV